MKDKGKNEFLKGTVTLSVSVIITKILGVAFKVPLSYVLGDEGMGYFNTAYAIYGLFYILCTAGVPKSMTIVLASYRGSSSGRESDGDVLRTGLSLFAKIGAFSTLLNIVCAPAFALAVGNRSACASIIAVAPSILFVSLSGVLRGYLNSSERLFEIAVSQLAEGAIKLLLGLSLALLGVRLGASVSTVSALAIIGITVGSIISCLYMMVVVFCKNTNIKTRQNGAFERKSITGRILKNALPIAFSSALLNLCSTLDLTIIIKRLVASGMSEIHANAIYGNYTTLAVPMFNLVIAVLAPIATSYMPRLSALHHAGDTKALSEAVNRLLLITLIISVPASLSFYFYSFDLLDVLFSLQSSAVGAELLVVLSLALPMLSGLTVVNTALESQGRISATVISLASGCAVKLAVSYVTIGTERVGVLGAPLGTVVSYAVSLAVSLLFLDRRGVKTRAVGKIFGLYLLGLAAFYPPYRLIYSRSPAPSSFLDMFISLAVSLAAFSLLLPLLYLLFGQSVFKMHKKQRYSLDERLKNKK